MAQSYRRPSTPQRRRRRHHRRSPLPLILLLLAVAALIWFMASRLSSHADPGTQAFSPSEAPSQAQTSPAPSDAPAVSPSAAPEPTLPPIEDAPWQLRLANQSHPLPEDWSVETSTLSNGLKVDARIYDDLTQMLADCAKAGYSALVCSAYRTIKKQTELFERKIKSFMSDGLSHDEAYTAASAIVAIPGTSEHNLGLAVDICASEYQLLNEAQADTPAQKWLMEHCWEYGFILRYPKGKQDITGIIYEPWHYRYVGRDLAQEITESGLCLEEYLALSYTGV